MKEKGILLPIFSLPSKYGIGDFGNEAYEFIDILSENGINYWEILPINACLRDDSRTEELSKALLSGLKGEITEISLYRENLKPLDREGLEKRNSHDYSGDEFNYARQFKDADIIVIAAPFWDLSFPSVLKIYFENITVSGITFKYTKEGIPEGRCKAEKLYYVTTSGGYIGENNLGFDYVKVLAQNFYGIDDVRFFSAEGLDIFGADVKEIMNEAKDCIMKGKC